MIDDAASRPGSIRPSALWYWVGGVTVAAGVVGAIIWLVVGIVEIVNKPDDFQRVEAPGGHEVVFEKAGGYTLYDESPGTSDSAAFRFDVTLTPVDSDREVHLASYSGDFTYSFGAHSGRAVATFHIDEPGTYLLRATSTTGTARGELAVGRGFAVRIVSTVVGVIVLGVVGLSAGGAIIAVTAVRRGRAKQELRSPAPIGVPYAGSPSPPAWPPPSPPG